MKIYKHYSFDLWMTLIRSNPAFKSKRTKFFYDHFNNHEKTLEEVGIIFSQIDVMCNAINEKTGGNIDAEEMYLMVINTMNNYHYPFQDIDLYALYKEMEQLVFKYTPVFYSEETGDILRRLKQEAGDSTFSLLSNTAFIKGRTLRTVLQMIELDNYFDFQLYSDEIGMSKPNKELFKLMVNIIKEKRATPVSLTEIVHIGDNAKADSWGAEQVGISSILINSNDQTIRNLLN